MRFHSAFIGFTLALCFWFQSASALRISVLTCGSGSDLYACYGHSAVRILDTASQLDVVYNYGTFNFSDEQFYWKFTRGQLPYYLNTESFAGFMGTYQQEHRSVIEQVLELPQDDAVRLKNFLEFNARVENKYYRYHFLFDNCSTRIRDLFPAQFGSRFQWGKAIEDGMYTYRQQLNRYEAPLPWTRSGINLLMSHRVDEKMNNEQSMFLPAFLMEGLRSATLDGKPILSTTQELISGQSLPSVPDEPRMAFWILFVMVVLLSFRPAIKPYLIYFDVLFFMLLGLLGCFILFMWFGTTHEVCRYNLHLFWVFPLHILFAAQLVRSPSWLSSYARYTSWLCMLTIVYRYFSIQELGAEWTPVILLSWMRLRAYVRSDGLSAIKNTFRYAYRTQNQ
ncbi:MAG TPA: DUF4105 domain-containing protein [Chitinophagaceae bacterium]|nr:DUF4105 domain-containing protein [Chitinophagaceae bacterium]HNF72454.1 DUF4105 domain-containing protein [Chitinophagaceae bacterium]